MQGERCKVGGLERGPVTSLAMLYPDHHVRGLRTQHHFVRGAKIVARSEVGYSRKEDSVLCINVYILRFLTGQNLFPGSS